MKKSGYFYAVIMVSILAGAAISQTRARHVPTPEGIIDLRGVSDPQISPDGERVAFVVTEPGNPDHPDRPPNQDIWMVATDGKTPPQKYAASEKKETTPRWSPDGRRLTFISDRGESKGEDKEPEPLKPQVWIMPADGGEAQPLTSLKGGVAAYTWSRDGKTLAILSPDPATPEEEARKKKREDRLYVDREWKYTRLYLCDVTTREVKLITKQEFNVGDVEWSPKGRELALAVSATPDLDQQYWHSRLLVVNREGEVIRTLSERSDGVDWGYSPDGEWIAFSERSPSEIGSYLSMVPAEGGQTTPLDAEFPGSIYWAKWAPDSKYLIVESIEGTRTFLSGFDSTVKRAKKMFELQIEAGRDHGFSLDADGSTIAFLDQKPDAPTDVWVIDEAQQQKRQLTHMNPQVGDWKLGTVEEISWKSKKDGKTIYGVLIKPPDYDPSKRYPTIVQVHGGPKWAWWTGWHGSWHEWGQLLATQGYVVLLPNPRGSDGQGIAFSQANRDDWGGGDFADILSGLDDLIDKKISDPDRLGIGGWSYGGFMASWAITQTQRFKAAVVGAGVTNLISFNGTTDITPSFLRTYFLDLPFNRREAYDRHSPMTFVKNVKTPTLVVHGAMDERVPPGQGQEFYHALKQTGVETEMVIYPRQHHGFQERAHQIDLLQRILAWYKEYV